MDGRRCVSEILLGNTRTYDSVWDDSANDTNSTVSVVGIVTFVHRVAIDQEDVWTYYMTRRFQLLLVEREAAVIWADENDNTYGDVVVTGDTV